MHAGIPRQSHRANSRDPIRVRANASPPASARSALRARTALGRGRARSPKGEHAGGGHHDIVHDDRGGVSWTSRRAQVR